MSREPVVINGVDVDNDMISSFKKRLIIKEGCWSWKSKPNKSGYSVFSYKKKPFYAHRFSFALFNGPLKEGLVIDHVCRNRSCLNPKHLRQVSQKINCIENSDSFSAINSRKTHCVKGHSLDKNNLRIRNNGSRRCLICQKNHNDKINARALALRRLNFKPKNVARNERHGMARLTEAQVKEIRRMLSCGFATRQITSKFKITKSNVYNIRDNKIWKNI
jgi:hypothetical protein